MLAKDILTEYFQRTCTVRGRVVSVCTYLLPGSNALKLQDETLYISHCEDMQE